MDIQSGFTYFYNTSVEELKNDDKVPEDDEFEADDPSLKGRYRCCYALIDCKLQPDTFQLIKTFDEKLFKQSSYVPSGQPPPEWAEYGCRSQILNSVEAFLREYRNNRQSKFLVKVRFGAYIRFDEEHEAEEEEEEEEEVKSVPAGKSTIEGLEKVSGLDRDEECAICLGGNLDNNEEKSLAMKMPCGHVYHQDCIVEWLRKSHSCPLCRYALPVDS